MAEANTSPSPLDPGSEIVAGQGQLPLTAPYSNNEASVQQTAEEWRAGLGQYGGKMTREEHARRARELNLKGGFMRSPRRGWSMTDYQSNHSIQLTSQQAASADSEHEPLPILKTTTPVPNAAQEATILPRRPRLPPPRRLYSILEYGSIDPSLLHPSSRLTLLDLPLELQHYLFDLLEPIDSVCLGLTHSKLYAIHRRKNGTVPLSSRYSGPNDIEKAWRDADTFVPRHIWDQIYCGKCGISRCELRRHLEDWMGADYEYCEIKEIYGKPAGKDAKPYCFMVSPKNPCRCARHGGKKAVGDMGSGTRYGDSKTSSNEASGQANMDLSNSKSATGFTMRGKRFDSSKADIRNFSNPKSQFPAHISQEIPFADSSDVVEPAKTISPPSAVEDEAEPVGDKGELQHWENKQSRILRRLTQLRSWLEKWARPKVKAGYRRIEWTCDCGVDLYADFALESDSVYLDKLVHSLQNSPSNPGTSGGDTNKGKEPSHANTVEAPKQNSEPVEGGDNRGSPSNPPTTLTQSSRDPSPHTNKPMFLALCVNTGGMYKTLAEVDTSSVKSDAEGFRLMKTAYLKYRGMKSLFTFLIKPITVEFVQFSLWNLRHGYVSICDRPNSIPPTDNVHYNYRPRPLKPLPPMPPEIFIHYLEHGARDLNPSRYDWLPRLLTRVMELVKSGEAVDGWGIHVIEGANREVVFWVMMITIFASFLASTLWSTLNSDIQGGTGLGSLIVALPSFIMTAFLFRLGAI